MVEEPKKRHSVKQEIPGVAKAMKALHDAVIADGALSAKMKELICVGIAVAIRCEHCLRFHAEEAARLGATPEEIAEAAGAGILLGGGPSWGIAARVLDRELHRLFESDQ